MAQSIEGGVVVVNTLSTKNNGDYPLVMAESVQMGSGENLEDKIADLELSGGGEPYELPVMSQTQLGGGKAVAKTTETVPVAVDGNGQLFVPEQSGGGSTAYVPPNKVEHGTSDTTFTLPPNVEHEWDEVLELTLTLQEGEEGKSNIHCVSFISGATPTHLEFSPKATLTKDIEPNGKYTIVIFNGIAAVGRSEL